MLVQYKQSDQYQQTKPEYKSEQS